MARDIENLPSVSDGNHNALELAALILFHLFDDRVGEVLYSVGLAFETCHRLLECSLFEFLSVAVDKLVFIKRTLHSQDFEKVFLATFKIVRFDGIDHAIPDNIGNIHSNSFAHQCVTTFFIDYGALFVHHVIIFQ